MKKKFVAGLCAFALALAMPAAALADNSPEYPARNDDGTYAGTVKGNTTTYNFEGTTLDKYDGLKSIVVGGAEGVTLEDVYYDITDSEDVPEGYDADAWKEYTEKINQVIDDEGKYMFSFELNGTKTGDHAVVTFKLDKDKYGNKTISYYILHKDGKIQEKVVDVKADGTVTIWMDSFSIITFMDVEGIAKYENMVQPQDGDLLSPKTGIC